MAKNGVRRAVVTEIGPDHVRVDVLGVCWASKPGYVAYAYFPTLNPLRPWENHPFSCNSTALFRSYKHALALLASASLKPCSLDDGRGIEKSTEPSLDDGHDGEKPTGKVLEAMVVHDTAAAAGAAGTGAVGTTGVTLIIKKNNGLTRLLKSNGPLLALLDGPYPQNPSSEILKCDHVLLIGGGVGITGLIAWIHAHPNVKLAWSVKSSAEALVREMEVVLSDVADKEIVVGERLSIEELLRSEAQAGYGKVGVVVCGPGGMCDAVRAGVAGLGRGGKTVFELEVDAFSW